MRYTTRQLENDVDRWNEQLEKEGLDKRIEVNPRNGYCAVDVFTVPRKNGCVDHNLQCGSPRECRDACETFYYQQFDRRNSR